MKDRDKTREQLLEEVIKLRQVMRELKDINAKHVEKEKSLLDDNYFSESIMNSLPGIFYFFDEKGRFIKWNRNFEHITGYSGDEIARMNPLDYFEGKDKEYIAGRIQDVFTRGESTAEAMLVSKSGEKRPYFFTGKRIILNGRAYLAGMGVDISEQKKMEEQLHRISITDELTGLLNRRGFFTMAEKQCEIAGRNNLNLSFLFIDLDGLKAINDTHGHQVGDMVLFDTATLLKVSFRSSDIISRIGGDEFVVMVTETPETNIEALTNRLKSNLGTYNEKESRPYDLSLSMGLTRYSPKTPCSIQELMKEADRLMYEQKKRKENKDD